jgi:hypothetical protein
MTTSSRAHSKTSLLLPRWPTHTANQALKRGRLLNNPKKIKKSKLIGTLTHGLEAMHFSPTCNNQLNQPKKRKVPLTFSAKKRNQLLNSQKSQAHSLPTWMD